MNERIKELAEQVVGPSRLHGGDFALMGNKQVEKFAQLIVQECASKVDNILREKKDGGGTMGDKIREHFGVEE